MDITSADIKLRVSRAVDGNGNFDVDAIVADLIEAYDLTGKAPSMSFDDIPAHELWDVISRHDNDAE